MSSLHNNQNSHQDSSDNENISDVSRHFDSFYGIEVFIRYVTRRAVWVAGSLLILSAIWVAIEVILRKIFVISVGGATEVSGYVLAIISSWAFSFTLLDRSHIRIDTIYRLFPRQLKTFSDLLSIASLMLFVLILTYFAAEMLLESIKLGEVSNTSLALPIWIPKILWVGGLVWFCIVLLWLTVLSSHALVLRDTATIVRLIGIGSHNEPVLGEDLKGSIQDTRPQSSDDSREKFK